MWDENILAKCSLDVPPAATSSNFGAVEHPDLEPNFSEPLWLAFVFQWFRFGPSHDTAHLNAAAKEVSSVNKEGCSYGQPEGKKRPRNIPAVESPSKRVRQTAPRATKRQTAVVMRNDGEGCSYVS
ncbi:hypothetical protein Tco_0953050 [Tanacetum coccineum]|uniref:Uncharacterized protein n=1 Tax=Tanacetum coccineum TaxID=301880 RepID=A0ABQ5DZ13_9ASTR